MLELHTPLPPPECLSKLRAATDPLWNIFGRKPALGGVLGDRFWGCRRISYNNAFQTFVFARVHPNGTGSRIRLSFGMSPLVIAFLVTWFGTLAIAPAAIIVSVIGGAARNWPAVALFGPILLLVFAAALVGFGRWLARNEKDFLMRFLREELSAS